MAKILDPHSAKQLAPQEKRRGRGFAVPKLELAFAGAIVGMAFLVRLAGFNYDFPYPFWAFTPQVDAVIGNALRMAENRTLLPDFQSFGPLFVYLITALYGAYFAIGWLLGWFSNSNDFALAFVTDPAAFFAIGRLFSAAMGALAVGLVYVLGRRVFSGTAGLLAALLLTLAFSHVLRSHWAYPDAFVTVLATLALIFIFRVAREGKTLDYLLAGAFVGLSTAAKYNAVLLVVPLLAAHLLYSRDRGLLLARMVVAKPMTLSLVAMAAVFLVTTPTWIFRFSTTLAAYQYESRVGLYGRPGMDVPEPRYLWPFTRLVIEETSLGVLAIAGVAYAFARRKPEDWVIIATLLPAYLAIGRFEYKSLHFFLPYYPMLALAGGRLAADILGRLSRFRGWAYALAAVVITVPMAVPLGRMEYVLLTQTDTRVQAKDWIEAHLPPGSHIGIYGPSYDSAPLLGYPGGVNGEYARAIGYWSLVQDDAETIARWESLFPGERLYHVDSIPVTWTGTFSLEPVSNYKSRGMEYLLLSSSTYGVFTDIPLYASQRHREIYDRSKAYFEDLMRPGNAEVTLLQEFRSPYTFRHYIGLNPVVRLYKIN